MNSRACRLATACIWLATACGRTEPSACTEVSCGTNAHCDERRGLCVCDDGFTGDATVACEPVEVCAADSCSGHGDCLETAAGVSCTCEVGWDGPRCASCAADHVNEGDVCIHSKLVACADLAPANATSTVVEVEVTYTDAGGWTAPAPCAYTCDEGTYTIGDECSASAPVDSCSVSWPAQPHVYAGDPVVVTGRLMSAAGTGAGAELPTVRAKACWSASLTAPVDMTQLSCTDATYDALCGDCAPSDGYVATLTFAEAGSQELLFAFSGDSGATWTLCDHHGIAGSTLMPARLGVSSVANGGLEQWNDAASVPAHWSTDAGLGVTRAAGRTGSWSARLVRATTVDADADLVAAAVPVMPGQSYTVRAWLRDDDTNAIGHLAYRFLDAAGGVLVDSTTAPDPSMYTWDGAEWQPLATSATAPVDAAALQGFVRVFAQGGGTATGGVIEVDDVSVVASATAVTHNAHQSFAAMTEDPPPGWDEFGVGSFVAGLLTSAASVRYYTRAVPPPLGDGEPFLVEAFLSAPALGGQAEHGAGVWVSFPDVNAPLFPPGAKVRRVEIRFIEYAGGQRQVRLYDGAGGGEMAALDLEWAARHRVRLKRQLVAGVDVIVLQGEPATELDDPAQANPDPDTARSVKVPLSSFGAILGSGTEIGFGHAIAGSYDSWWGSIHISRGDDPAVVLPYWPVAPPTPTLTAHPASASGSTAIDLDVSLVPSGAYLASDVAQLVLATAGGTLIRSFADPSNTCGGRLHADFDDVAPSQTVTGWVEVQDASGRKRTGPSVELAIP